MNRKRYLDMAFSLIICHNINGLNDKRTDLHCPCKTPPRASRQGRGHGWAGRPFRWLGWVDGRSGGEDQRGWFLRSELGLGFGTKTTHSPHLVSDSSYAKG